MRSSRIYKLSLVPARLVMCISGLLAIDLIWQTDRKSMSTWKSFCWNCLHTAGFFELLYLAYQKNLSRLSGETVGLAGDIISILVSLMGYTVLSSVHFLLQLESTWKARSFDGIVSNFGFMLKKLQRDFNRMDLDHSSLSWHCWFFYGSFSVQTFVMIALFIFNEAGFDAIIYLLITMYSEWAIKTKLLEIQIIVSQIIDLQQNLKSIAEACAMKLHSSRLEPWVERRKCFNDVRKLQELHSELWAGARRACAYFEWSLVGLMLKIFVDLSFESYWILLAFESMEILVYQLYTIFSIIFQLWDVLTTFSLCSMCTKLDEQFGLVFIAFSAKQADVQSSVYLRPLCLQLLHEPIFITAGSFFEMNLRTLGKYLLAAVSYFVILLQFHISFWENLEDDDY